MKLSVYALAESALFRMTPFHYALAALLAVHLVRVAVRRYKFIQRTAWIPGPPALPILGNALSLTVPQHVFFKMLIEYGTKYGRIFRLWVGQRPFVFLSTAESIQPILNSMQHIDKSYEYEFLKDWLGNGLITVTGMRWQKRRKLLTPSFHWDILATSADEIGEQVEILLSLLKPHAESGKVFNVMPHLKLCGLDIICVTAMGKNIGAQTQQNEEYVEAVDNCCTVVQRRFITPWLKPNFIFRMSALGKLQEKSLEIVYKFVRQVINTRREDMRKKKTESANDSTAVSEPIRTRKPFLDLLLEAVEEGAELTDVDVEDEVNTFMFAGHDTSTTAVGWCLYVLGKHPEIQEKIVQEYREELKKGDTFYKTIKNLHYTDMCVKETLRLFPVAPLIARDIKQDVPLPNGHVLPAGVTALLYLTLLQRDPVDFPEPDKFRPERWIPANMETRHPFSYIPFSAGPRNCIGQKFAGVTTKLILVKILNKFHVTSVDPEEKLNLVIDIVLSNKEGINIILKPREDSV